MVDFRLLAEFFLTLKSDGVRLGVEDQARLRKLFASQTEWDLTTLGVALRSLLAHDPHQRAIFDQHFSRFFSEEDGDKISAENLRQVLEDLRNLKPDLDQNVEPRLSDPHSKTITAAPERRDERHRPWRKYLFALMN